MFAVIAFLYIFISNEVTGGQGDTYQKTDAPEQAGGSESVSGQSFQPTIRNTFRVGISFYQRNPEKDR